jgi:hypothetical protein
MLCHFRKGVTLIGKEFRIQPIRWMVRRIGEGKSAMGALPAHTPQGVVNEKVT